LFVEEGAVAKTSFWGAGMGEAGSWECKSSLIHMMFIRQKLESCNSCAFGEAVGLA
jgi:hypothetical protein